MADTEKGKAPAAHHEQGFDPLVHGATFTKFGSLGKPHPRDVKISLEKSTIFWTSPKKSENKTTIRFYEIKEIREGQKTSKFGKRPDPALEDRAFSIIYGSSFKTLDLLAENNDVRDIWVNSLKVLMEESKALDPIKVFLQQAWKKADKNHDNQLDLEEIIKLLASLNVALTKSQIKSTFNKFKGEKGTLDFEGFTKFYKEIKYRKEIETIFQGVAKQDPARANVAELKKFLTEVQKQSVTDAQVKEIIKKYADGFSREDSIALEGFANFLTSQSDIWKASRLKINQDMTQPLSHYWINSSHNTYLLQDQLKGPSSVEAYIRAFQAGCRCVEMDCWDGHDGKPIIYHGHTLTSKILFEDVVKAVKEYAFVASDYPVILSLEVHTSVEQQTTMAKILKDVLGDLISTEPLPETATALPSPEKLKRRVLIKGKALPRNVKTEDYDTDDEEDEDDDLPEEAKEMKAEQGKKKGEVKKVKVAQELSDLVNYCKTAHFKSFEECREKGKPDQMSSFAEAKSVKLSTHQRDDFIGYNMKQLSRIYPAGARVDSSNYDPRVQWNAGCQIVAFNYQTLDRPLQLNHGKFADNGGAGYVLKPEFMRKKDGARAPAKKLTLTVISAQQLPKPGQSSKGEIIDPYVEVEVVGEDEDSVSKKTKVIDDNGFNPEYNETFEFSIKTPEITLVRFAVFDKDVNNDDFIASATIPFEAMEEGYRHIHLRDSKNTILSLGTLFLKIEITKA